MSEKAFYKRVLVVVLSSCMVLIALLGYALLGGIGLLGGAILLLLVLLADAIDRAARAENRRAELREVDQRERDGGR